MKNLFITLFSTLFVAINLNAQIGIPPSSNSPFGQSQSNLLTGQPIINIPITDIGVKGMSVPISLGYNASGHKVDAVASWVGLGWNLNSGGFITRIVREVPDDYKNDNNPSEPLGMLHSEVAQAVNNFDPLAVDAYDQLLAFDNDTWEGAVDPDDPDQDTEPDVFLYNINGRSGGFYFDKNKQIQQVPATNLKISYEIIGDELSSFAVIDELGNRYLFEDVETTKYRLSEVPKHTEIHTLDNAFNSTWRISKITTQLGEEIDFFYSGNSYEFKTTAQEIAYNCSNGACGGNDLKLKTVMTVEIHEKLVSRIESEYAELKFKKSLLAREDLKGLVGTPKYLADISLFRKIPNYVNIKNWGLIYDYFNSPGGDTEEYKRLKLTNLIEYFGEGEDAKLLPPHEFEYNTTNSLPQRRSNAQDLWGYYNGNDEARTLIPRMIYYEDKSFDRYRVLPDPNYPDTHQKYSLNGAIRTPSEQHMKAGILKKIVSPEGGVTEYNYESHSYYYDGAQYEGGGLRIASVKVNDGISNENDITTTYEYADTEDNGIVFSGRLVYKPIFGSFDYEPLTDDDYEQRNQLSLDDPLSFYRKNSLASSTSSVLTVSPQNVVYKNVQVKQEGQGWIDYEFDVRGVWGCGVSCGTNVELYSESSVYTAHGGHDDGTSCSYLTRTREFQGRNAMANAQNPNFDWFRGKLLRQTVYNESGDKVTETINHFKTYYQNSVGPNYLYGLKVKQANAAARYDDDGDEKCTPIKSVFVYSKYKIYTGVARVLDYSETKQYHETDPSRFITARTDYDYDSRGQVRSVKQTTPEAIEWVTNYNYPYDFPDHYDTYSMAQSSNNIIATPIETYTTRDGKTVGASVTQFDCFDCVTSNGHLTGKFLPVETYALESFSAGDTYTPASSALVLDDDMINQMRFDEYDDKSNLLQMTDVLSGIPTSYIYGYNQSLRIATVQNATYDDIEGVEGFGPGFSLGNTGFNQGAQLLRDNLPDALVSATWYEPLVGVTKEEGPNGLKTTYSYDEFGRLSTVRDHDNNLLEQYEYNYSRVIPEITPEELNRPPVVSLNTSSGEYIGTTVTADASGSFDPDGDDITFEWEVNGHTRTSTESSITFTVSEYGSNTVRVEVRDEYNQLASKTKTVTGIQPISQTSQNTLGIDLQYASVWGYIMDCNGNGVSGVTMHEPLSNRTGVSQPSGRYDVNLIVGNAAEIEVHSSSRDDHDFYRINEPIYGGDGGRKDFCVNVSGCSCTNANVQVNSEDTNQGIWNDNGEFWVQPEQ